MSGVFKEADDGDSPPHKKKIQLTSGMLCSLRLPDPWRWNR